MNVNPTRNIQIRGVLLHTAASSERCVLFSWTIWGCIYRALHISKGRAKGGTYQQAWVPPYHKIHTFSHIPQQGPNNRQHSHVEAAQSFLNYAGDQKHGDDLQIPPSAFLCLPVPAVEWACREYNLLTDCTSHTSPLQLKKQQKYPEKDCNSQM